MDEETLVSGGTSRIESLFLSIDQVLLISGDNPRGAQGKSYLLADTPYRRMEDFLTLYGPYEYCISPNPHRRREINDFKERKYPDFKMNYGRMSLGIETAGKQEPLSAIAMSYMADNFDFDMPENVRYSSTEIGNVILMEDGTIAWFYNTSRSPLSHTGGTYPPKKTRGETDLLPYPIDPKEGIATYIRSELLGFLHQIKGESLILEYKDHGQFQRTLQGQEAQKVVDGKEEAPVVHVSPEEYVDFILDTKAFKALTTLVALAIGSFNNIK